MSSSWSAETRFKRTEIAKFPVIRSKVKTEDAEYWKYLQQPVTIREYGPVQNVDISHVEPYYVAVTGSSRVQIFNPLTNSVHKTLSKFRETAFGGKFRKDGNLLCIGGDDGTLKIFDVSSKSLLRTLSGHTNATHLGHFMDNKHLASFSDDKTVRVWDISTEEEVQRLEKHTVNLEFRRPCRAKTDHYCFRITSELAVYHRFLRTSSFPGPMITLSMSGTRGRPVQFILSYTVLLLNML